MPAPFLSLPIINGKTEITLVEIGEPKSRSLPSDGIAIRPTKFRVSYADLDINERSSVDDFFKLVEGWVRPWDFEHGRRHYSPCFFDTEAVFWSKSEHGYSTMMQFHGMKE